MKHTVQFRRKQLYKKLMKIIRDEYPTRKQLGLWSTGELEPKGWYVRVLDLPSESGSPPTTE